MNVLLLSLYLSLDVAAQPPREPPPPPEPLLPAPVPTPTVVPAKPPTFNEFVRQFVPVPGIHDVTIIHPVTKKPVNVVFRLPDQPLRKTFNSGTRITYDYGKTEVTLIFRIINGKVDVRYD